MSNVENKYWWSDLYLTIKDAEGGYINAYAVIGVIGKEYVAAIGAFNSDGAFIPEGPCSHFKSSDIADNHKAVLWCSKDDALNYIDDHKGR